MTSPLPLSGKRVIDFGQLTAGANTSAMLADLGADVIKIESPANLDLFRLVGAVDRDPGWWNRSPAFRFSNRNKRSMALDLKTDEGRRLARELIAESDVVVENFRRGVLERLGLEYPALQAANPRIVLASISSQGETGPYRLHASFGSTLDASGGLAAMTGYDGGAPLVSGSDVNYPDQVVSLLAVGLILAALRDVARTGAGTRLDISQREIVSFLLGEQIVAAGAQQHSVTARRGNTDDDVVLQDCFACADARWIAVTVVDAASATRVLELTGPGPSLRGSLTAWCIVRSASDAAAMLAQACISAVPVMNGLDLLDATQLWGAALSSDRHGDLVKGMPYAFAGLPFAVRCAAPDLGQDTNDILRDVLGLGDADMARLQALGVTRTDV